MAADLLYKVAYDEAVRALSEQQEAIVSFHTRAGLLFSAAAITTSFLGTEARGGGGLNFASWAALLCFVAVTAASLAILWPRAWDVTVDPREVIDSYIEPVDPAPIEELHRELSLHMHRSYLKNRNKLGNLSSSFRLLAFCWQLRWCFGLSLSQWLHRRLIVTHNEKPAPRAEPKRPSPMYTDPGMTLREMIAILTPGWAKRSSRRERSS